MDKFALYLPVYTNVNADSGPFHPGRSPRGAPRKLLLLLLVDHTLSLGRQLVLWLSIAFYIIPHKDLDSSLRNNEVSYAYIRLCLSLKFCPHTSVVFNFFFSKRQKSPGRTNVHFPIMTHKYNKDHNYIKMSISSLKKHLFHGSKAAKANVLETSRPNSVPEPPERQTSLVSFLPLQIFKATDSLREDFSLFAISLSLCQTSTVAPNESSSPSSPPLEATLPANVTNKVEARLSQAGLVNRKQEHHSSPGN